MTIDTQLANSVSPSFCAAKWTQVTLHLQTGLGHSCHHPKATPIPIEELQENPSSLHNTPHKIKQREMMMKGERPKECGYCWKLEDVGEISDRHIKTTADWSQPFIEEIVKDPYNKNYNPKYVEISFSNLCNFKCSYCSPNFSSQWREEIEILGPYPLSYGFNSLDYQAKVFYRNNEDNPYIDAWWRWYDSLVDDLMVLRVTGGEPFLNKNLHQLLERLLENPKPHLNLYVNSNLYVPNQINEKVFSMVERLIKNKCIRKFELYTSAEAYGKQAEYIRWGLNYEKWKENFIKWGTNLEEIKIIIMSTFNILSVVSYRKFLEDVLKLKIMLFKNKNRLILDIPYLRYPLHQVCWLLPKEFVSYVNDAEDFMIKNSGKDFDSFTNFEISKIKRVKTLMLKEWNDENWFNRYQVQRQDFVKFVDEHDRRRGSNFLETFPEMMDFYNSIKAEIRNSNDSNSSHDI